MSVNYLSCFCTANKIDGNPGRPYQTKVVFNRTIQRIEPGDNLYNSSLLMTFLIETEFPVYVYEFQTSTSEFNNLVFPEGSLFGTELNLYLYDKDHIHPSGSGLSNDTMLAQIEYYSYASWATPKVNTDYHCTLGDKITVNKYAYYHHPYAYISNVFSNVPPDNPYANLIGFSGYDQYGSDKYGGSLDARWITYPESVTGPFWSGTNKLTLTGSSHTDTKIRNVSYKNAYPETNPQVKETRRESYRIVHKNSPSFSSVEEWWAACQAIEAQ